MSAEEAVTDAVKPTVDPNAQAAEDAKNLLAELQGSDDVKPKETNGADAATNGEDKKESAEPEKEDTAPAKREANDRYEKRDRRDGGRGSGRGGRGGNRGGRGGNRNYRDNIKSDLISQEVSDDPVAIRKQVQVLLPQKMFM